MNNFEIILASIQSERSCVHKQRLLIYAGQAQLVKRTAVQRPADRTALSERLATRVLCIREGLSLGDAGIAESTCLLKSGAHAQPMLHPMTTHSATPTHMAQPTRLTPHATPQAVIVA